MSTYVCFEECVLYVQVFPKARTCNIYILLYYCNRAKQKVENKQTKPPLGAHLWDVHCFYFSFRIFLTSFWEIWCCLHVMYVKFMCGPIGYIWYLLDLLYMENGEKSKQKQTSQIIHIYILLSFYPNNSYIIMHDNQVYNKATITKKRGCTPN